MSMDEFDRRIETAERRIAQLYLRATPGDGLSAGMLGEAFDELRTSVEELQVAQEEMRVQNEELAIAQGLIEHERKRYENLFQFAPIGYVVTDRTGIIREANHAAGGLLRIRPDFLTGKPFANFVDRPERQRFRVYLLHLKTRVSPLPMTLKLCPRDGIPFDADLTCDIADEAEGNPAALRWTIRDITSHQEALRLSEERLRLAIEGADIGIFHWGISTGELEWSDRCKAMFGLSPVAKMDHELFIQCIHPEDRERVAVATRDAVERVHDFDAEYRVVWPDGGIHWISARAKCFVGLGGASLRMEGIAQNMDARHASEEQKLRDREKMAEQERQAAIFKERNRIAQEIHDTLAQGFTGIAIQLEAAQDVFKEKPDQALAHTRRARQLACDSLAEARRSVRALRPQVLETQDLAGALRYFVEMTTTGTAVLGQVDVVGEPYTLEHDVETHLLRIGQEALTNALRHGQPTHVRITLTFEPERMRIHVWDDGQGFDLRATSSEQGFGLIGIRERTESIHGACRISSAHGQGTEVDVCIPNPKRIGELHASG